MEFQTQLYTPELIESGLDYRDYRTMINQLLAQKRTTGMNHSQAYLDYTRMNVTRMARLDKTVRVSADMEQVVGAIDSPQYWLILTEAWCGDAAQNIPYIAKLASLNPRIKVRLILRDEHPAVMDSHLTSGARSIPKLIALGHDLKEILFTWGPRPLFLQNRMEAYKVDPQGISPAEFAEGAHLWYARDKNRTLEQELMPLLASTYTG